MEKFDKNTTLEDLKVMAAKFRDERDWAQFHNPKQIAEAIAIEAGELLELMLWKTGEETAEQFKTDPEYRERVQDELADVIQFCLLFAEENDIDITQATIEKLQKSGKKYPVEKAKGRKEKYNAL